jgi:hypothetical protein
VTLEDRARKRYEVDVSDGDWTALAPWQEAWRCEVDPDRDPGRMRVLAEQEDVIRRVTRHREDHEFVLRLLLITRARRCLPAASPQLRAYRLPPVSAQMPGRGSCEPNFAT